MEFIDIPNLPVGKVRLMVVDGRIDGEIESVLKGRGVDLIKTMPCEGLYDAIKYHPDIMLNHVGRNKIVHAPGLNKEFLAMLKRYGFELIRGEKELRYKYPGNIAYNVLRVGSFAFHNFKYTDPVLKNELINAGVRLIDIRQGYSKCSAAVINNNSIITSDKGIRDKASENGIEVFYMEPEESIKLPGLSYGFIGGSTGMLDKDILCVSGRLENLKACDRILRFLNKQGITIISLSNKDIVDYGSLIPLLI